MQLINLKAANYLTLLFDLFLEVLFSILGSRFFFFILFHYLLSKKRITVMSNSSHSFHCKRLRKKTHHWFLRKNSWKIPVKQNSKLQPWEMIMFGFFAAIFETFLYYWKPSIENARLKIRLSWWSSTLRGGEAHLYRHSQREMFKVLENWKFYRWFLSVHICATTVIKSCSRELSTEAENYFCLRNEPALSVLPQHQQQAAVGDEVLGPAGSDGTEKPPWSTEYFVPFSQDPTYLGTEETFPPEMGKDFWLSGFSTAQGWKKTLQRIPVSIQSSSQRGLCLRSCVLCFEHRNTDWLKSLVLTQNTWQMHNGVFYMSVQGDLLISPWPKEQIFSYENPLTPQHIPPPVTHVLWAEIPQALTLYEPSSNLKTSPTQFFQPSQRVWNQKRGEGIVTKK